MLLDDPLEHGRIALPIPRSLGIDDGDGAAFADPQAIRLRSKNASLLGQLQLLEPLLQETPRGESAFLVAALRLFLIAAEEDVPAGDGNANARRDVALGIGHAQV